MTSASARSRQPGSGSPPSALTRASVWNVETNGTSRTCLRRWRDDAAEPVVGVDDVDAAVGRDVLEHAGRERRRARRAAPPSGGRAARPRCARPVTGLDEHLGAAARRGRRRVYVVHSTPAWASDDTISRTYTFMPPLSPEPGCSSGEVCSEITATRRTAVETLSSRSAIRKQPSPSERWVVWPVQPADEALVDVGAVRASAQGSASGRPRSPRGTVLAARVLVGEDAGPHVERLDADPAAPGQAVGASPPRACAARARSARGTGSTPRPARPAGAPTAWRARAGCE